MEGEGGGVEGTLIPEAEVVDVCDFCLVRPLGLTG